MSRQDADTALAQAIRDHATAYDLSADDEMLNDYAIVAHWQPIDEDGTSRYTMHFTRQTIPNHVAVGLFTIGAGLVDQAEETT